MKQKNYNTFVALHKDKEPLVLYNCWNIATALSIEKLHGSAIATSSYAIAKSLGYDDGEMISFSLLKTIVSKISEHTSIPLSIDIETGYGNNMDTILNNVLQLVQCGVVGINLEDQILGAKDYRMEDIKIQSAKIKSILSFINNKGYNLFINARTDIFLMERRHTMHTVDLALERCNAYKEAGAQCIFIPGLTDSYLISEFTNKASLPVNIMLTDTSPSISELRQMGVKRISYGPRSFLQANQDFEKQIKEHTHDYK